MRIRNFTPKPQCFFFFFEETFTVEDNKETKVRKIYSVIAYIRTEGARKDTLSCKTIANSHARDQE